MWDANAINAINAIAVRVFSLAIAIAFTSIGGCDGGAAPRHAAKAAQDGPQLELPVGRYQIDPGRNRLWVLTREGVLVYDLARPERNALSLPDWLLVGTSYACPPDLALGPGGEAVITSNIVPTLWRVDPDTLAVSVHPLALDADTDKDVGFSALAYSPQHGAFLAASHAHGSLWRIDPLLKGARKIPLSAPIPEPCGLAVRPRGSWQALGGRTDLCVRTPRGDWSVVFAGDGRSAYVSAVPCTDRPRPFAFNTLTGGN